MIRSLWLSLWYGRNHIKAMRGDSLPAQWKSVRLSKLDGHAEQTPQVKYAKPDRVKLRAPEEIAKWRRLRDRRRA